MTVTARTGRSTGHVLGCRVVSDPAGVAAHHAIRAEVFVTEQGLFTGSDADDRDLARATLRVVGYVDGVAAGTVRLYPSDPADPGGDWQGDRLAVRTGYRSHGLGAPLVRFAVATAGSLGGGRMIAHVQQANGVFFRRLGWTQQGGPELYVGRPHLLMTIPLGPPGP